MIDKRTYGSMLQSFRKQLEDNGAKLCVINRYSLTGLERSLRIEPRNGKARTYYYGEEFTSKMLEALIASGLGFAICYGEEDKRDKNWTHSLLNMIS